MIILDVCVGSEKIYFGMNKNLKDSFIGIDIRKGDFSFEKREGCVTSHSIIVKPLILASMKLLPFKDKSINVIVMDPPHLNLGKNSFMGRAYGSWNRQELVSTIYRANEEFKRVLVDNGTLIIKILPEDKDRYISLLNNFTFFLPIHVIRQQGCLNTKEAKLAACWYVGIKND
jgi:hypothetical protein